MKELIDISKKYYNEGLINLKNKNLNKAINDLNISIDIYSHDEDAFNLLGIAYFLKADFNNAIQCWNDSLQVNPGDNKAVEYMEYINSHEFDLVVDTYNKAINYYNSKDYISCIELMEEVIRYNPEIVETYEILASCYLNLNKIDDAGVIVSKIKEMDISNEYIHTIEKKGFDKVLNAKTKESSGKSYLWKIAASILVIILLSFNLYQRNKLNKEADVFLMSQLSLNEKINNMEKDFEELMDSNNMLNDQIIELQLTDTSVPDIDEVIVEFKINDEATLFNSGLKAFRNKDFNESIDSFTRIIDYGTEPYLVSESTYFLAVSYENKENIEEAMNWYKNYIANYRFENYYDDSIYNYGLLLYKSGFKDKAKEVLSLLAKDVPGSIFNNSKVSFIIRE